ncbi:methylosome protein WDR77-like [Ruditapes philippinarum]|uniref:methylosome protein WDR77-like n=1 Tax=Ruditapes philippinarum TaxID=129788 RepID=UPI00295B2A5E|nr:methylosome protein WDR77-like [Ruditapes philippinarum]
MDQTPAVMDKHLEVVQCHKDGGILLGASSLTGRYWYGSLWYYQNPQLAPDVEKCTAGVQLEAGLNDACWVDDTRVLVGLDTGGVALWELTDNLHTFIQQSSATEHDNIVSSVCVCQDKKKVISASYDHSIRVWDLENFASVRRFKGHTDAIYCVRSHPTQPDLCLTASQDGSIFLWDLRKQKPATRLDKSPLSNIPTCVAWQPGEEHVYGVGSNSGHLVVRDTRAAVTESVSAKPHYRGINRIQFSPTQKNMLASVSEDCTAIVVDVSTDKPQQIYRCTSHTDFVKGVSWSGENTLITCGWDAQVCSHTISRDNIPANSEAGPTKMEVNGEQGEVTTADVNDTEKLVTKCRMNGDGSGDVNTTTDTPT